MDLKETEYTTKSLQEYTEELYKKDLHDPDNHDGVITHLEPDILECEVKWALESITTEWRPQISSEPCLLPTLRGSSDGPDVLRELSPERQREGACSLWSCWLPGKEFPALLFWQLGACQICSEGPV